MTSSRQDQLIALIQDQIRPAVGCTEPGAAAYAAAVAAQTLGETPERLTVSVSRNILKNAMGVGIPGTDMVGLPIAVALGALCGDAGAGLAVLHNITDEDVAQAQKLVDAQGVQVCLSDHPQKLYIDVLAEAGEHSARTVIAGTHTNIIRIEKDGQCISTGDGAEESGAAGGDAELSLKEIDDFVRSVSSEKLNFLRECIDMNSAISQEGLEHPYGLGIGQSIYETLPENNSEENYALAVTCAAADARMGGCTLPVMSSCGSGNQGLTATLPVIAVARKRGLSEEDTFRALAYSLLVTIHVKQHLGKLSALCACSVGASIGTACALTYLDGGTLQQIGHCVDNVVADVSGVICDGAKAGCALKIATGVSSAFRGAMLAMKNRNASALDGIVGHDPEASVDNLGNLCNTGMLDTDRVILDMLVCK